MLKKGSLIFFSVTVLLLPLAFGQETDRQKAGFGLTYEPISAMKVSPFVYYCIPHEGPVKDMPTVIERFIQTTKTQNIVPAGPLFGIFYDNPNRRGSERLEWEVGCLLREQYRPKAPLMKRQWKYTLVTSDLHVGPYTKTGETIAKMLKWMEISGYVPVGPVMERYSESNPSETKPEELKTEIWIPCKKRGEVNLEHQG